MKDKELAKFKIGDKLAFQSGYYGDWDVYEVSRVTPTGIATAGPYKINADMTIRGTRERRYYGPYRAEIVTDAILAKVKRQRCLSELSHVKWAKLTDETLIAVCDIINSAKEVTNDKQ